MDRFAAGRDSELGIGLGVLISGLGASYILYTRVGGFIVS
jgi:hypothetical protein